MAFTQSDLSAIEHAIKTGTLSVQYKDRTVTYRNLDELQTIKALIEKDILRSASTGTGMYPRYQRASFSDE
jgi:hypothetical protein